MQPKMTASDMARLAMRQAETHGKPNTILPDGSERVRIQAGKLLLQAFLEIRRDDDICAFLRGAIDGEDLCNRDFGLRESDGDDLYFLAEKLEERAYEMAAKWRERADYIVGAA